MVGWFEQAKTLETLFPTDLKGFSVMGLVPRMTFLVVDSCPVEGLSW